MKQFNYNKPEEWPLLIRRCKCFSNVLGVASKSEARVLEQAVLYFLVVCPMVYCNNICLLTGLCIVTSQSVTTANSPLPTGTCMFYCLLLQHVFTYRLIFSDKPECRDGQCSTSQWYVLLFVTTTCSYSFTGSQIVTSQSVVMSSALVPTGMHRHQNRGAVGALPPHFTKQLL